jgi:hypothetical protein
MGPKTQEKKMLIHHNKHKNMGAHSMVPFHKKWHSIENDAIVFHMTNYYIVIMSCAKTTNKQISGNNFINMDVVGFFFFFLFSFFLNLEIYLCKIIFLNK